jgi:2'-5' RNA ligase
MRMFVAVWPPPEVVDAVAAFRRPVLEGVRWTRPEQWHVTLRFLGEVADHRVPSLVAALGPVAARTDPCVATMGPATDRFGGSIVHVPVAGLGDLAAEVASATSGYGDAPVEDRPFHGHLTLARIRSSGGRRRRTTVPPELTGVALSGSWMVDELSVVASERLAGGAHYRTVAALPLGTPDDGSGGAVGARHSL